MWEKISLDGSIHDWSTTYTSLSLLVEARSLRGDTRLAAACGAIQAPVRRRRHGAARSQSSRISPARGRASVGRAVI
jgi:hypothetical protein